MHQASPPSALVGLPASTTRPGSMRLALVLASVLLVALAIRVAFLVVPTGIVPSRLVYDEANYHEAAVRLLSRGYFAYGSGPIGSHPNAATMPGYTVFLAGIFSLSGSGAAGIRNALLVQALLSALTVWLAYLIGSRVGGRPTGLVSAVLVAFYPPLVYANATLMNETLFTFVLSLVAWMALACLQRPTMPRYLVLGLLAGVAALIRPEAAILLGITLAILYSSGRPTPRRAIAFGSVCVLGLILMMTPWWVRNYRVYHRAVVTTTLTANPLLAATYWPASPPGDVAVWPTSSGADESALDARWRSLALDRVASRLRSDPWGLLRGRLVMTGDAVAVPYAMPFLDGSPMTPPQIWLNRATRFAHWLLLVLSATGIVVFRSDPRVRVLGGIVIARLVLYAVAFPLPRYALPSIPLIAILAALSVTSVVARRLGKLPER